MGSRLIFSSMIVFTKLVKIMGKINVGGGVVPERVRKLQDKLCMIIRKFLYQDERFYLDFITFCH